MNINGERTILRAIETTDTALLQNIINDPETEFLLGGWSFPISSIEQNEWIQNISSDRSKTTLRAMIDVIEKDVTDIQAANVNTIGTVILSDIDYKNGTAQIHIKLADDGYRHKGYGTDATQALVGFAFQELRLNCVYATISEFNTLSQNMFDRLGFKKEGIMRSRLYKRGKYINLIMYSILNQ